MNRLPNKVAIVTGAAGGMGESIARLFAEEGASVLATDIQFEKMNAWVQEARGQKLPIACIGHDVTSWSDWQKVVEKALQLYGKIDILVNNAGVYQPLETTEGTSLERWNKILAINATSAFLGAKAALPHLKKSGKGAIVNVSSIAGMVGGNGAPYSASKAAMRLLTKDQAVEFASFGIRVNSIHPGGVLTPMTENILPADALERSAMMKAMCPLGRIGEAIEIAYGALFLASDEASYVTGTELVIDGGMTAR
ncbi:MAG: SDR family oxidoreductase [Haliscomenobacteraceae bacterium CHB4]|nr:Cyclopentanol dehydrogenase [Saprospiraceae bacterium]MCE7926341.1 SDR family oxidoreductase [Haliscomenobacteraceae bacterium CHB4]